MVARWRVWVEPPPRWAMFRQPRRRRSTRSKRPSAPGRGERFDSKGVGGETEACLRPARSRSSERSMPCRGRRWTARRVGVPAKKKTVVRLLLRRSNALAPVFPAARMSPATTEDQDAGRDTSWSARVAGRHDSPRGPPHAPGSTCRAANKTPEPLAPPLANCASPIFRGVLRAASGAHSAAPNISRHYCPRGASGFC